MRCLSAMFCVFGLSALASADSWYDTLGFEGYNYGPINGQGVTPNVPAGWHDISSPSTNVAIVSGSPGGAGRTLRLQIPNIQGDTSAAEVVFAQDLRDIANDVTVEFSVYRQSDAWNSNLWFFPNGTNPAYGLQWDGGNGVSQTLPVGFDGVGVPTVMDTWTTMKLAFDFTGANPVANGYYNGNLVTTLTYTDPFTQFTGWTFSLQHDEAADPSDTETLWIDNFKVSYTPIPEPASLALLAMGTLLLRRR